MTYKALRRKSDKQWIHYDEGFYPTSTPHEFNYEMDGLGKYTGVDMSIYELVEVAVICMEDVPSDEEIEEKRLEFWNDMIDGNTATRLLNWFKSQILK